MKLSERNMVVIVDYGMGNIFSIQSALKFLGIENKLSALAEDILNADRIVLPGVGSFRRAMENLKGKGLDEVIRQAVFEKKTPLLGICLGMQLLGVSSTEDGFTKGLCLIDAPVERFSLEDSENKVPHVGFNTVTAEKNSVLFKNLPTKTDFYFTHSFYMHCHGNGYVSGTCLHGKIFAAAVEKENIFGAQFHPEKSQSNGLMVLKNFMEWRQN